MDITHSIAFLGFFTANNILLTSICEMRTSCSTMKRKRSLKKSYTGRTVRNTTGKIMTSENSQQYYVAYDEEYESATFVRKYNTEINLGNYLQIREFDTKTCRKKFSEIQQYNDTSINCLIGLHAEQMFRL